MVDLALVRAILEEASAIAVPGLLLVALGLGESELNPEAVGDNGKAFGVYQVHPEFHGYPAAMWLGVGGARNAIRHLWTAPGHWRDAWEQFDGPTWFPASPAAFLCEWWPAAQRSSRPTLARCQDVIARAEELIRQVAAPSQTKGNGSMGTHASPLYGRKGYWLRQFNDTGEGTLPAILDSLTGLGGGDCLCLKVADGETWQGWIDPSMNLRNLDDLRRIQDECTARGVAFLPVVVPRGESPLEEAEFHAAIASQCGALMTDIEPYEGFWDRSPYARIPEYTARLREAAPSAYLINQPDPRAFAVRDARVKQTAQHFDGISAQHYVGWRSASWTDVDAEVARFDELAALGREMYVTLYGVERTDLAGAFWDRVKDRALGVHAFAFGPMNADQLRWFASLPRPVLPETKPTPIRSWATEYAAELRGIIAAAEDDKVRADVRIADATAKLKGLAA